jgi:hypothetical protein
MWPFARVALAHGCFFLCFEVRDERIATIFDGPAEPRERRTYPTPSPIAQGPDRLANLGCRGGFVEPVGKNSGRHGALRGTQKQAKAVCGKDVPIGGNFPAV